MKLSHSLRAFALSAVRAEARGLDLRGTDRVLRLLHHPERQQDHIEETSLFDENFFQIDTRSYIEWRLFNYGHYRGGDVSLLQRLSHPGAIVFDIGANIGVFTIPLARSVGPNGRVYAFEPHPQLVPRLQENVALNNLRNVVVCASAIGDSIGEMDLSASKKANQGMATLGAKESLEDHFTVKVETLDHFMTLHTISRLDVIKIDAQGAEFAVLSGGHQTLAIHKPSLNIRCAAANLALFGATAADVYTLISDLGYRVWKNARVDRGKPKLIPLRRASEALNSETWLAVHPQSVAIETSNIDEQVEHATVASHDSGFARV